MSNIRKRFDAPRKVQSMPQGESLTQAHFAPESDVNRIVARHLKSGPGRNLSNIGPGGTRQPMFGDFSNIDYQSMLNTVQDIDNIFRRLPARVRSRFHNDPGQVLRFVSEPSNLKEAVKMGLVDIPEGMAATEEGDLIEQVDLTTEAAKAPAPAPKADEEANPTFKQGGTPK